MICQCEHCTIKRSKFKEIVSILSDGQGTSRAKIQRNVREIPENFLSDMRKLLMRMRREGDSNLMSKNQLEFFKKYKRLLRDFIRPNERDLLSRKRRYLQRNIPLAEAFGKAYLENPTPFDMILKEMSFH